MKRYIILALISCFAQWITAQTISVPDQSITSGRISTISIFLDNKEEITAFQLNAIFPKEISIQDISLSETRQSATHEIRWEKIEDRHFILAYSLKNESFKGESGCLLEIKVLNNSDAALGNYPITLKDIILTDKSGKETEQAEVYGMLMLIPLVVEAISLNKKEVSIEKGGTETLVATVMPEDATNKHLVWSSSDTQVAAVDNDGTVTALKGGTATVTVALDGNPELHATCLVTVIANAESVSLNKTELSIEKGKTESLIATVMPEDATNKHLVWSSSDTQVAAVDNDGTVTALKGGTATVTVALDGNPELHATCLVTVIANAESVSLNKTELSIEKGKTESLIATVMPEDATNKHLVWSSSDTQVAAVDNDGTVTALKGGTATVTVALDGNPELHATCLVTVIANAESVSLNKTELSIEKGKTESLIATVMPEDATNKHLVWSSSDTQVAAVDNDGTVTALKGGTATVTVALDGNPELHATCLVTVNDPTGIENNVLSEIKVIATVVEQEIILYGIPADDSIRINIYDMGGNTLYQQKVQDKTLIIPCSHYPKGIYLIQINEQGKNKIIKIVKK